MHSPMKKIIGHDTGMHPSPAPLRLQDPPRLPSQPGVLATQYIYMDGNTNNPPQASLPPSDFRLKLVRHEWVVGQGYSVCRGRADDDTDMLTPETGEGQGTRPPPRDSGHRGPHPAGTAEPCRSGEYPHRRLSNPTQTAAVARA